jgi:hypothetical protein
MRNYTYIIAPFHAYFAASLHIAVPSLIMESEQVLMDKAAWLVELA